MLLIHPIRTTSTVSAAFLSHTSRRSSSLYFLHRHHSTTSAGVPSNYSSHSRSPSVNPKCLPQHLSARIRSSRRKMSTLSSSSPLSFQAWRVDQQESDGSFQGSEQTLSMDSLILSTAASSAATTTTTDAAAKDVGDDSVLIRVSHSSLNYKDALSASGNKGVTRRFPHTPGIDAAGTIVLVGDNPAGTQDESQNDDNDNNLVLVTGYDLGMNTNGGFGEYIRVPKSWIVSPVPGGLTAKTAMIYGTAGLTAGLCVQKLLQMGATPSVATATVAVDDDDGETRDSATKNSNNKVLVTGATGAVGSVAVELLSKLGFSVVAMTGKANVGRHKEHLLSLGAHQVVGRDVLTPQNNKKPLLKPVFAHAIDTVGGTPLVELLKQIQPGGSVACCGLVAGHQLDHMTVLPFILRGINLLGVDSVEIPLEDKRAVWEKLATTWNCPKTEASAKEIGRHELDDCLKAILKGESAGKIVLNHGLTKKRKL